MKPNEFLESVDECLKQMDQETKDRFIREFAMTVGRENKQMEFLNMLRSFALPQVLWNQDEDKFSAMGPKNIVEALEKITQGRYTLVIEENEFYDQCFNSDPDTPEYIANIYQDVIHILNEAWLLVKRNVQETNYDQAFQILEALNKLEIRVQMDGSFRIKPFIFLLENHFIDIDPMEYAMAWLQCCFFKDGQDYGAYIACGFLTENDFLNKPRLIDLLNERLKQPAEKFEEFAADLGTHASLGGSYAMGQLVYSCLKYVKDPTDREMIMETAMENYPEIYLNQMESHYRHREYEKVLEMAQAVYTPEDNGEPVSADIFNLGMKAASILKKPEEARLFGFKSLEIQCTSERMMEFCLYSQDPVGKSSVPYWLDDCLDNENKFFLEEDELLAAMVCFLYYQEWELLDDMFFKKKLLSPQTKAEYLIKYFDAYYEEDYSLWNQIFRRSQAEKKVPKKKQIWLLKNLVQQIDDFAKDTLGYFSSRYKTFAQLYNSAGIILQNLGEPDGRIKLLRFYYRKHKRYSLLKHELEICGGPYPVQSDEEVKIKLLGLTA